MLPIDSDLKETFAATCLSGQRNNDITNPGSRLNNRSQKDSPRMSSFKDSHNSNGQNKSMVNYLESILTNPKKKAVINVIERTSIDIKRMKQEEANRSQMISTRSNKR